MLCLERWAERSGLLAFPGYAPRRIGWDFPCVSDRQRDSFGMHGCVKASGWENRLAFEEEYDRDGVHYMNAYVPLEQ